MVLCRFIPVCICLWALDLTMGSAVCAQIPFVTDGSRAAIAGSTESDVRSAHYIWPQDRQILPNPFRVAIQPVTFRNAARNPALRDVTDEPLQPVTSAQNADAQESAKASDADPPGDEDSDLAARVQALEEQLTGRSNENEDGADGAGDGAVLSRLDHLEETLVEFESDGSQYMESLARNSRRVTNGRIHLDSWQFPISSPGINAIENGEVLKDPENRLLVRRARVGIRGTVPPDNMSYRLELEFSGRDGGRIRDAWLAWDDLPVLNTLRIGNQKRPYGLDQLNSSNFMTFLERPLMIDAINRNNRRIGLASYGGSSDLVWNWQTGVFAMDPIQNTNDIVGDKAQLELAGRLANTAWYDEMSDGRGYAHVALAGTLAFPDSQGRGSQAQFRTQPEAPTGADWLDTGMVAGASAYQLCALESVLNVGAFQLTGEWMQVWMQRDAGFGSDLSFQGGYVSLSWFLTGEHIPWNRDLGMLGRVEPFENFFCVNECDGGRGRGLGAWQVALRLSRADFSDDDIRGGVGESLTMALNWYWNANTRLQFNYIFGQIEDRRTTLTNGMTPVVGGNYQIMGTRFMIDF